MSGDFDFSGTGKPHAVTPHPDPAAVRVETPPIQRYYMAVMPDPVNGGPYAASVKDSNGGWVPYADHDTELSTLTRERDELREALGVAVAAEAAWSKNWTERHNKNSDNWMIALPEIARMDTNPHIARARKEQGHG